MKLKFDIVANIIGGIFELANKNIELLSIPKDHLIMYELRLEFQNWDKKFSNLNRLMAQLIFQINQINDSIEFINQNIILLNEDFNHLKIRKIKVKKSLISKNLKNILKKIILPTGKSETLMPYINQTLYSYIYQLTLHVKEDANKIVSTISNKKEEFLKKFIFPSLYKKYIYEVVDLYILGYKNTSLLVLGKIYEDIFNRYLIKLKELKELKSAINLKKMTFQNKIDFMRSNKLISHKDWLVVSKLVWDRNIGGHSVKNDKETKDSQLEAQSTIKLALNLLNKYSDKVSVIGK